jgi:hypothetical protein
METSKLHELAKKFTFWWMKQMKEVNSDNWEDGLVPIATVGTVCSSRFLLCFFED